MDEQIQRALDGDVSARMGLNPHEAKRLAETEEMVRSVLHSIPAPELPELAPSVLARIATIETPPVRSVSRVAQMRNWIWAPRALSLNWRPAYALAAVALIAAATILRDGQQSPAALPAAQQVLVQFRLDAPNAQQVQLAGNFTDWKAAVPLKRSGAGAWTVVLPLSPGVHNYVFVVDGREWIPDPMAPAVSDGFGGQNSQLALLPPDRARSL